MSNSGQNGYIGIGYKNHMKKRKYGHTINVSGKVFHSFNIFQETVIFCVCISTYKLNNEVI